MINIWRKIKTFFTIERHVLFLLPETLLISSFAHFILLFLPFNYVSNILGELHKKPSPEGEKRGVKNIGRAISIICRNVPWDAACYTQAISAKIMLWHRKIECTIYIGAYKDIDENIFKGHAWVKAGDQFITGRKGHKKYKILAFYT